MLGLGKAGAKALAFSGLKRLKNQEWTEMLKKLNLKRYPEKLF